MSDFKVLLVEDNQEFREFVRGVLRDRFPLLQVSEAGTCNEALAIMDLKLHDLVFMDIHLPDGLGLDLIPVFRNRYRKAAVVILTSYDVPEYREAAINSGARQFLNKCYSSCYEILCLVEKTMAECGTPPVLLG